MKNEFLLLLISLSPGVIYADTISNIVKFNGETYSTCSVSISKPQFKMGTFRASWGTSYALASGGSGVIDIEFSECDPGTKVTIKAKGSMNSASVNPTVWLKNEEPNGSQDLYVASYIKFPENDTVHWLSLDETNGKQYTIPAGKTSAKIALNSVLRRSNTNVYPVGKYSARMTLFFEFQ